MKIRKTGYLTALTIAALLVFLPSCDMPSNAKLEANKEVIRQFEEAINNQEFDLLDDLMMPDLVRHCQATPEVQVRSLEEFKALQEGFLLSIPDQRIATDIIFGEGDYVATYSTYSGTQEGPMGNFPTSGKKVELTFPTIFRLVDGKIAEIWVEWDNISFLSQLGHFPPPEAGSGKE